MEFCAELIKAAACLTLRCPRLAEAYAEAVNECCACAVTAERRALQGRENARETDILYTHRYNISFKHLIDRWQTFRRGFRRSFATAQH